MPLTIQPPSVQSQEVTVTPDPIDVPGQTVVVPAIVVTDAQMISALQAEGWVITSSAVPPTPPAFAVATANRFTARIDVNYTPPAGKTVVSYAAKGNSAATAFFVGTDTLPSFLVQGENGSLAATTSIAFAVTITLSDGSVVTGTTNAVSIEATNGSIVPQDGLMYSKGIFYGKGSFPFGGVVESYYATDADGTHILVTETTGGGGHQPYWPVTAQQGVDTTKFKSLVFIIKPSVDMAFSSSFMSNGDVQDGVAQVSQIAKAGVLTTITLPLAGFKITANALKYSVGSSTNFGKPVTFNIYQEGLV